MTDNIEKLSLANKQEIITIILKTSYRYEKVLPIILDSKNNKEPYEWMSEVSESHSVMSNSLWPQGLYSPWNSPEYWSGQPFPPPGDLPNPGIKPRSPTWQAGSLPAEPQGKSKKTGVGSLSDLQQIFLTQESNQGLLHCRQTLYQLSYQGRKKHMRALNFRNLSFKRLGGIHTNTLKCDL